jgi:hypothetical protein
MVIEKPFTSYEEVEKHALKLRLLSETALLRFGNHCHALADKEVRSTLFKGAVSDAIHDIKPVRKAAELMTSGGIGSQLLMGMLTRKGGLMRRLLTSLAAVVVPNLLGKVPWADVGSKLSGALRTAKVHEHNGHGMH